MLTITYNYSYLFVRLRKFFNCKVLKNFKIFKFQNSQIVSHTLRCYDKTEINITLKSYFISVSHESRIFAH